MPPQAMGSDTTFVIYSLKVTLIDKESYLFLDYLDYLFLDLFLNYRSS